MALRMLPSAALRFPRVLSGNLSLNSSPLPSLFRPVAISLTLPGIFSDIWDSVLRAVPKKKTSHMKKRHRQMAGKALKDVKNLSNCPGCGEVKRSHVLCPNCVKGMYAGMVDSARVDNLPDVKKQWKEL